MKTLWFILFTCMCIYLPCSRLFAKQMALPPKYDEELLKKDFDAFIESLDSLSISKNYPKAVQKLLSGDPKKQVQGLNTLTATEEIEVIPWLLLFLESPSSNLRIQAGLSLEKLVSAQVLKRRDRSIGEMVIIKPLDPKDKDLRPLAWIVLKMFRKPDDGNTHAYAATMTRYLGLNRFDRELHNCLKSRHSAVSNTAKWALESLQKQNEYEKKLPIKKMNNTKNNTK